MAIPPETVNEIRSEILDNRAKYIDRWLASIAAILTFFGIVIALATYLGFKTFLDIEAEAEAHVERIKDQVKEADAALTWIRKLQNDADKYVQTQVTAKMATVDSTEAKQAAQAVEVVLENPKADRVAKEIASAVSLQRKGDEEKAIEKWRGVTDIAAKKESGKEIKDIAARAWLSIGYLVRDKNTNDAIADFDKAIELKPDFAEAYLNRGIAKAQLKNFHGAIKDFDKAIELNNEYAQAWHNRGYARHQLKRHNDAIADFDKAIELKPDFAEAYLNRGDAKRAVGLTVEARKDFEVALDLGRHSGNTDLVARAEKSLSAL